MADDDFSNLGIAFPDDPQPADTSPYGQPASQYSDVGNAVMSGASGVQSAIQSGAAYLNKGTPDEAYWDDLAAQSRRNGGDYVKAMTPADRAGFESSVTDGTFWQHPLWNSVMKASSMAPAVVAAALPGGIVGDVAGVVAAAGVNAALSTGQLIDGVSAGIMSAKDADLRAQSDKYDNLRASGLSVSDAKEQLRDYVVNGNGRIALVAIGGAIGGGAGVGGIAARGLGGGVLARLFTGGAEGMGAGAVQAGTLDYAQQSALAQAGQGQVDGVQWTKSVIDGMAMGGVAGAAGGAIHAKPEEPVKAPVKTPTAGEASPTRSSQDYAKAPKDESGVEVSADGTTKADEAAVPKADKPAAPVENKPTTQPDPTIDAALQAALAPKAAPVTPESNAPAQAIPSPAEAAPAVPAPGAPATDTAIPESPQTLAIQHQEMLTGQRSLMVFKGGVGVDEQPLQGGMKQTKIGKDIYRYDPAKIKPTDIRSAVENDTVGQILGLGPVSKNEVLSRVAGGETPVGITERAPDGTEVKGAVGTTETAAIQHASLDQNKTPGNTVQIEPVTKVPAERAAARNILPDQSPEAQAHVEQTNAQIEANKAAPVSAEEMKAGNRTKAQKAERQNSNDVANEIMAKHVPQPAEEHAINPANKGGMGSRTAVLARAKAMLDEAQSRGIKIAGTIKDTADETYAHSDGMLLLKEAQDLTKTKIPKTADYERFVKREYLLRAGERKSVLEARRVEGSAGAKKGDEAQAEWGKGAQPEDVGGVTHEAAPVETALGDVAAGGHEETADEETRRKELETIASLDAEAKARREAARAEGVASVAAKAPPKVESRWKKPTPAQAEAGNYVKPKIVLNGKKISIETPKGETREGVTPEGKKWAVRMPGDYGYIRGTMGADGDHVDVLLGNKRGSDDAFVINQIDPKTGAFDEHKVIMGVRTEAEARDLYKRSFSDGSGEKRIGGIVHMPTDHLNEWLADRSQTARPAEDMPGQVTDGYGRKFTPLETITAGQMLSKITPRAGGPGLGKLLPFLQRKLQALVGDTPVHWVDGHTMDRLLPPDKQGRSAAGYYDSVTKHIVMNIDADSTHYAYTAMHEATHAALHDAIEKSVEAQNQIKLMMKVFRDAGVGPKGDYALTDIHEFMSELFSRADLQEFAMKTLLPEDVAAQLGVPQFRAQSLWSSITGWARQVLFGTKPLPPNFNTLLEGVLSVGERLTWDKDPLAAQQYEQRLGRANAQPAPVFGKRKLATFTEDADAVTHPAEEGSKRQAALTLASNAVQKVMQSGPTSEGFIARGVKILSNDQMRQMWEKHFGPLDENNPMRKATDAIERMTVRAQKILQPGNALARELAIARTKFEGDKGWDKFANLTQEASEHNLHPDRSLDANTHLRLPKGETDETKGAMDNWAARKAHARLAADYDSLPAPLKALWGQLRDFYAQEHQARSEANIRSLLGNHPAPAGSTTADVVSRALTGKMTEADAEHYEGLGIGNALKNATEFQKVQGFYAPKKRFGDFVVTGKHDIKVPANAKSIDERTLEFNSRKEAHNYATSQDLPFDVSKAYYDPATGKRVENAAAGLSTAGSAIEKYHVTLERNHVEFADTVKGARAVRQAMIDSGVKEVSDVDRRSKNPSVDYGLTSPQVESLIKAVNKRDDLNDGQKAQLTQSLRESAVAMKRGNRIEPHYLKRRDVAGASDDVVRTLTTYARASAAFRARAELSPEVDGAMNAMSKIVEANKSDGNLFVRRIAHQELEARLHGFGSPEYMGRMAPFMQKVMMLSFWKRMLSPAHLLIHMTHPGMISAPVLGSRHGFGQAYRELWRSYRDMGGVAPALLKGMKGIGDVYKNDTGPTNFLDYFRGKLAGAKDGANLVRMMKALEATGHIHSDAGMEVSHYNETATPTQRAMEKFDRAFRELTSATESVNRVAEAVAAYRLEMRKNGGDHEAAVRYAKDTLANTQGLYSATNAAPLFRNPMLRPFLQFKQFPQMIYHLLGRNLYQTFKGETPEIRWQAAKAFGGVVATHAAMAGALGLPLEVIKAPVMLAAALTGGQTPTWESIEDKVRRASAEAFGPQLGEIFSDGLTRALGPLSADVHHRLGLGSVSMYGEPSSEKSGDILNWLLDTIAGAPGSMLTDTIDASQAMMHGDVETAFEKASPAKALTDVFKAARLGVYGKPAPSGQPGMAPLSAGQTFVTALGFKSGQAAQYDAARRASQVAQKENNTEKAALLSAWKNAKGSDQGKAMIAISKWNSSQPVAERISQNELNRASVPAHTVLGQKVTNRNKTLLDQYNQLYNVQ